MFPTTIFTAITTIMSSERKNDSEVSPMLTAAAEAEQEELIRAYEEELNMIDRELAEEKASDTEVFVEETEAEETDVEEDEAVVEESDDDIELAALVAPHLFRTGQEYGPTTPTDDENELVALDLAIDERQQEILAQILREQQAAEANGSGSNSDSDSDATLPYDEEEDPMFGALISTIGAGNGSSEYLNTALTLESSMNRLNRSLAAISNHVFPGAGHPHIHHNNYRLAITDFVTSVSTVAQTLGVTEVMSRELDRPYEFAPVEDMIESAEAIHPYRGVSDNIADAANLFASDVLNVNETAVIGSRYVRRRARDARNAAQPY